MRRIERLHLDTNALIFGLRSSHPIHVQLLELSEQGAVLAVSAMAWSEFHCGPTSPDEIAIWEPLLSHHILPIDQTIAERAAILFNRTGRRSRSLPDCIVAATAITHDAPLATLNQADFERFIPFGLALI